MKKVLLGTASLVGLTLMAAPASAQITVTLGGSVEFEGAWFDTGATNSNNMDFRTDTEIWVRADGKADNGLMYGAYVELEADENTTTASDEHNLYIAGSWGRIELGDQDGAADQLFINVPTVGNGQVDGSFDSYIPFTTFADPLDTSDDTKITYLTPSFSGFRAGISFVPTVGGAGATGLAVDQTDNTAGQRENGLELGVQYRGTFDGFSVGVAGVFNRFEGETSATTDIQNWGVAGQVGYAGFIVGAQYWKGDTTVTQDGSMWGVGATYTIGQLGIGAQYLDGKNINGTLDPTVWGVGVNYFVAPGFSVGADLVFTDTGTVDGEALITSVKLVF